MDEWEIVDGVEEAPTLEAFIKEENKFKRDEKKAFGIIATNLDVTNFAHVITCKRATNA